VIYSCCIIFIWVNTLTKVSWSHPCMRSLGSKKSISFWYFCASNWQNKNTSWPTGVVTSKSSTCVWGTDIVDHLAKSIIDRFSKIFLVRWVTWLRYKVDAQLVCPIKYTIATITIESIRNLSNRGLKPFSK